MLEAILDDCEKFSDSSDLMIEDDFCYINLIKLISYD